MNIQKELHTLVHEPDGSPAKQQLHTLVDDLHEEQIVDAKDDFEHRQSQESDPRVWVAEPFHAQGSPLR